MKKTSARFPLVAGLLLGVAAITAQASSTIINFSVDMSVAYANNNFYPPPAGTDAVYVFGTFNGWSGPGLELFPVGDTMIYTNSYTDTSDANGGVVDYRFNINGNNESTACWDNRASKLPSASGATLNLATPYYGDVGPGPGAVINVTFQVDMSEEIELGHFNPSTDQVDIRGSFNGWGNSGAYLTRDTTILVTNYNFPAFPGGLVESNVYTATVPIETGAEISGVPATNAMMEWKAVEDPSGSWESPGYGNADDAGNRFWFNNTNQTLPVVSFADLPYTPLAQVTFNVDMSGVVQEDPDYVPGSVVVWGTFNNWASGVNLTNNPSSSNTNIFSTVIPMGQDAQILYQFRYTNSAALAAGVQSGWVYDFIQDMVFNNNFRRTITVPIGVLNTNVPTIYFDDLAPNDLLPVATPVMFSVDMTGAVGTDSHAFDPGSDGVYINGMFADYGDYPQSWYPWEAGLTPPAPAGYQMMQEGSSLIYTNTIVLPAGTPIAISYNYGIDPGNSYGGPVQDEGTVNHYRVVRSSALDPYIMPVDLFTNAPYTEPYFSESGGAASINLSVGAPVAGKIPVSWLGRPGANLQVATSLAPGAWQNVPATDGTNMTSGYNSANGFVSVTNWPAAGNAYFRVVHPFKP